MSEAFDQHNEPVGKTRARAVRALPYADDLGMDIDDTGLVMLPICRRAS
jgi:hypothetical protein